MAVGADRRGVPAQDLTFVCPLCRGLLTSAPEAFACGPCVRRYPRHDGIPDFRVFPDPYLGFEEDRARTEAVLEALHRYDLPGLLEHYWSLSDITPPDLRRRFIRGALQGEAKARRFLRVLDEAAPVREATPADAADETVAQLPALQRAQEAMYRRLKRSRLLRPLLLRIAPEWDVRLAKGALQPHRAHP